MFDEANLADPHLGTTLQPFGRANSLETMNDEPLTVWGRGQQAFASAAIGGFLRAGAFNADWDLAVVRASVPFQASPPRPSLRWQGGAVEVERTTAGPSRSGCRATGMNIAAPCRNRCATTSRTTPAGCNARSAPSRSRSPARPPPWRRPSIL